MTKSKLAILFDSVLVSIILCFVLFLWIQRKLKNAFLSLFLCIFISILVFIAIFLRQIKKYNLNKLKLKDLKFAENCFSYLTFCKENEYIDFFKNLLSCKRITGFIFENTKFIFYINLKTTLSEKDFFIANEYYLLNTKNKTLLFIQSNYDEQFLKLMQSSPHKFLIYNKSDLFNIMKSSNTFPIQRTTQAPKQPKLQILKIRLNSSLTKNKFKDFFISGLSLLTISLFIPYSIYYLICGSTLITLSLICLLNKQKTPSSQKQESLLDLIKK